MFSAKVRRRPFPSAGFRDSRPLALAIEFEGTHLHDKLFTTADDITADLLLFLLLQCDALQGSLRCRISHLTLKYQLRTSRSGTMLIWQRMITSEFRLSQKLDLRPHHHVSLGELAVSHMLETSITIATSPAWPFSQSSPSTAHHRRPWTRGFHCKVWAIRKHPLIGFLMIVEMLEKQHCLCKRPLTAGGVALIDGCCAWPYVIGIFSRCVARR